MDQTLFSIAIYCIFFLLLTLKFSYGKGEWKQRGVVTGFIVALYTEMWGFPLSLLVITSLYGGNQLPYQFDNLMYYFTQSQTQITDPFYHPSLYFRIEYITARGLALLAVLPIIYGWFTLTKNLEKGLVTDGAYKFSRNPQYIGFILFTIGMMLYWPTLITIPMGIILVLLYFYLSLSEEKDLRDKFGQIYIDYSEETPRFVGKNFLKIFRLPTGLSLTEKLVEVTFLIPFLLWFVEAVVSWGLGGEDLVRQYWMPIAYYFPVHIGVLISIVLMICMGIYSISKQIKHLN